MTTVMGPDGPVEFTIGPVRPIFEARTTPSGIFAVHLSLVEGAEADDGLAYMVTHCPSGFGAYWNDNLGRAMRVAAHLESTRDQWPWTADLATIKAKCRDAVVAAMAWDDAREVQP